MKKVLFILSAIVIFNQIPQAKADSTTDKIAIGIIAGAIGYAAGRDSREHDRYIEERNRGYDRRPGHAPGGGYYNNASYLDATRLQCRRTYQGAKVCESYISWNLYSHNPNELVSVTVSVPTSNQYHERMDRLFACGRSGSQLANWIYAGHTYVFKMFRAYDCREGAYYGRPLREIVVRTEY